MMTGDGSATKADPLSESVQGISLTRVTSILLASRLAGFVLLLVNSVILARALGVAGLGAYAYALGVAAVFGLLPSLGISTVITRAIARDPSGSGGLLRSAQHAQAMMAGIVFCVIVGFGVALPQQPVPLRYIVLAAAQLALGALSWPYLAVLGGRARYDLLAAVELTVGFTGTLLLLIAVGTGGGVASFLGAQVVTAGAAIVVARHVAAPFVPLQRGAAAGVFALLREAGPFGAAAFVQSLYTRVDVILLGQMASASMLGLYSAAYKPINMITNFGASAAGTLFPYLIHEARTGPSGSFDRVMRVFAVAAPALALALSGISDTLLRSLYGPEFAAAAPILMVLAWSAAANWLYAPVSIALQAKGEVRGWVWALCGALAMNLSLNLWLIPRWGGMGAAVSTLVCEVALLAVGSYLMKQALHIMPLSRTVAALMAASGLGAGALYALRPAGVIASTFGALAIYAGVLLLCRVATTDDVAKLFGRFRETALNHARA